MGGDHSRQAADTPWRHVGVGMSDTFRCGRCDQPRKSSGRRKRRVRGLETYVCQSCAAAADAGRK